MNISSLQAALACAVSMNVAVAYGATDIEELNKKLEEYEQRIESLEGQQAEDRLSGSTASEYSRRKTTNNQFNPAISVILDGVYASYKNNP